MYKLCCIRFKKGLQVTGVLDCMVQFPNEWQTVFTQSKNNKVTSQRLLNLFLPQYSVEGSNERARERLVVTFWRDWVIEVGGKETCILSTLT